MAEQEQDDESTGGTRATIAGLLKHEITRLSRKVLRSEIEPLRKAVTHYRSQSAEFRRRIASLERELAAIKRAQAKRASTSSQDDESDESPRRWQARGLLTHRRKLGLSAGDYARLVGVRGLSIYKWEQGKNTPRRAQLLALSKIRGLGKREARRRLAELDAATPSPASWRKPGRRSRAADTA